MPTKTMKKILKNPLCKKCGFRTLTKESIEKKECEDCRISKDKLALPKLENIESINIISKMYQDLGSIETCKTLEDFGIYRSKLIKLFDEEITSIKKGQ